jgi:conjugal transfer/entry exclusion protein
LKQIRALHAKQAEAIALRESDLSDEERSKRSEKRRRLREGSRRYRAKKKALRDRGQ